MLSMNQNDISPREDDKNKALFAFGPNCVFSLIVFSITAIGFCFCWPEGDTFYTLSEGLWGVLYVALPMTLMCSLMDSGAWDVSRDK